MANTRQTLGDQETVDALVSNTLTSLEENGITTLANYSLYNHTTLTSINFPNLTSTGEHCFDGCSGITSVAMPNATNIKTYSFNGCTGLTSISLPEATTLGIYAFNGCTHLATVSVPKLTTLSANTFQNCDALTSFDVPATVTQIPANCFNGSGLRHIILRRTSMVSLANVNAFANTPIATYSGAIYVPSALVDIYKADNVWKNFFITSIDEYPISYSPQVALWEEINTASQNGTYTDYAIGKTVFLTMGKYTATMELVAKDADDLADGSGKAHMTWISKDILFNSKMNNSNTTNGGYPGSLMYTTIANLKNSIDSTIQGYMKPVTKTWSDYSTGSKVVNSSTETFWIPSHREIFNSSSYEDSGAAYSSKFTSSNNRKKNLNGSAYDWWLRSANSTASFRSVYASGTENYDIASSSCGVVPGFCI